MKTMFSIAAVLCFALLVVACSGDEQSNSASQLGSYIEPTDAPTHDAEIVQVDYSEQATDEEHIESVIERMMAGSEFDGATDTYAGGSCGRSVRGCELRGLA